MATGGTLQGKPPIESGASQNDMDYLHVINWKRAEELVNAGIMKAGEGLHPSSKGARVRFSGNKRTVIDGPFAETKELVAGFWIWECKSLQEAIEWLKKWPAIDGDAHVELELRQIFEAEDFGPEFTPELREAEDKLRADIERRK